MMRTKIATTTKTRKMTMSLKPGRFIRPSNPAKV
jgi:hypothetical protein